MLSKSISQLRGYIMFQNYNLQQPDNSNSCGAYSLGALINARNLGTPANAPLGNTIYASVIQLQHDLTDYPDAFTNDTPLSLPSTLVTLAIQHGFNDGIQVMTTPALPVELEPLVAPQRALIGQSATVIASEAYLQGMVQAAGFYLVLVAGGTHWIALGRNAHGFYAYDPATGEHGVPTALVDNRLTFRTQDYIFAGILICL
jgi:hypothetical protein